MGYLCWRLQCVKHASVRCRFPAVSTGDLISSVSLLKTPSESKDYLTLWIFKERRNANCQTKTKRKTKIMKERKHQDLKQKNNCWKNERCINRDLRRRIVHDTTLKSRWMKITLYKTFAFVFILTGFCRSIFSAMYSWLSVMATSLQTDVTFNRFR